RRARVSFAHFGGTAVSAGQTEFALARETRNERHVVTGGVEGPLASTERLSSPRGHCCEITCDRRWQALRGSVARCRALIRSRPCPARRRAPWQRSRARASTNRVREAPRASTTPSAIAGRPICHDAAQ